MFYRLRVIIIIVIGVILGVFASAIFLLENEDYVLEDGDFCEYDALFSISSEEIDASSEKNYFSFRYMSCYKPNTEYLYEGENIPCLRFILINKSGNKLKHDLKATGNIKYKGKLILKDVPVIYDVKSVGKVPDGMHTVIRVPVKKSDVKKIDKLKSAEDLVKLEIFDIKCKQDFPVKN